MHLRSSGFLESCRARLRILTLKIRKQGVPQWPSHEGFSVVPAVARVQSLARELLYASGVAKKKRGGGKRSGNRLKSRRVSPQRHTEDA